MVDLRTDAIRASEIRGASSMWPSIDLDERASYDLELLACGAFSPLTGFLGPDDYDRVVTEMRLADGTLWPIPVTLAVDHATAGTLAVGQPVALRDAEGVMLGAMTVEHLWRPDLRREAQLVYGTADTDHPGVSWVLASPPWYLGGRLEVLEMPRRYDFTELRLTPQQVRQRFAGLGWNRVIAFQTRNPIHRAHLEITVGAATREDARLLIHPVVGMTKPGDIDHYTRVRAYQAIMPMYPPGVADLALLPLAMRMAGPREGVWHAIIRRNFGCTHLIVGRDHAGPGADASGKPFYEPYEAQDLVAAHSDEIGVRVVPFRELRYDPRRGRNITDEESGHANALTISGAELREMLARGLDIPDWFTFPPVVDELRRTYPARLDQGFTVFFTGLPGSGKSTIANVLRIRLLENGGRQVTLLDGDLVRRNLSSELGFSREHRDLNVYRIGYVASEITKHRGIAICAPIAPYDRVRTQVRKMIEPHGGFLLIHVATPLEVCEQRDRKGLYAKARAGLIGAFTGVSDPYESPKDADVVIDTTDTSPDQATALILERLGALGYVPVA